jgi:hypothetical protein
MFRLEAFLLRFRRLAAPPGLAGPAAVSVDRTADITMELAGLLSAIDAVEDEADAIGRQAMERSLARTTLAESQASDQLAEVDRRLSGVRAEVMKQRRHSQALEARTLIRHARTEAARIERTAALRAPDLVDRVATCIRALRE